MAIRLRPRTYDEWKAKGYHVVKGEKARRFRQDGKALFTQRQVAKTTVFPNGGTGGYDAYVEGWDYEGSWEETFSEYDMPGPFG